MLYLRWIMILRTSMIFFTLSDSTRTNTTLFFVKWPDSNLTCILAFWYNTASHFCFPLAILSFLPEVLGCVEDTVISLFIFVIISFFSKQWNFFIYIVNFLAKLDLLTWLVCCCLYPFLSSCRDAVVLLFELACRIVWARWQLQNKTLIHFYISNLEASSVKVLWGSSLTSFLSIRLMIPEFFIELRCAYVTAFFVSPPAKKGQLQILNINLDFYDVQSNRFTSVRFNNSIISKFWCYRPSLTLNASINIGFLQLSIFPFSAS